MRVAKPNMMLKVGVELSGRSGAVLIDFKLLASEPPLRDPRGVVAPDGTIDLRLVPLDPRYGRAIDIVFELSGTIELDGERRHPVFASPVSRAFRIERKRMRARRVFQARFPRGSRARRRTTVIVTDSNDDGMVWEYALGFYVPTLPSWFGQYDPAIINRKHGDGGST